MLSIDVLQSHLELNQKNGLAVLAWRIQAIPTLSIYSSDKPCTCTEMRVKVALVLVLNLKKKYFCKEKTLIPCGFVGGEATAR